MISLKNITGKKNEPTEPGTETPKQKGNIFGQSLNAGQVLKSKKSQYIEAKKKKKAYLTLGASMTVLVLYSVFFFYGNTAAYLKAPAKIASLQSEIEEYNEVIMPSLEKTKELHKAAYDQEFEEVIESLSVVFPEEIDKLGIVRLFESFATEVAAAYPPFEFTSINLSTPQQRDGYMVIPVSTSIHSSLAGFDRLLSLVDASGYIYSGEGEDRTLIEKKIRLMNISNISVKYRGVDEATGKDQGVDFSVKLNLYSRSEAPSKN
ncbi:MAG: hypothetical protein JRC86_11165 [Deltaproteobacteria bacterium]|nr:hypothetical protein [Deltaproteobacteria bacterium]